MSTAAIETTEAPATPATRRGGSARSAETTARRRSETELARSSAATEQALAELVNGTVDAVRAFVPQAALRPTEAVDYVFDLAEQALGVTRRFCYEVAALVEAGVQGTERRAA